MKFKLFPNLPFWLNGREIKAVATAIGKVWDDVHQAYVAAEKQANPDECHDVLLSTHAWDRYIKRFPGEDNKNFRIRVNNSAEFEFRSGTIKGLKEILDTYGIKATITERDANADWDIISFILESQADEWLVTILCYEYGAVCRRFSTYIDYSASIYTAGGMICDDEHTAAYKITEFPTQPIRISTGIVSDDEHTTTYTMTKFLTPSIRMSTGIVSDEEHTASVVLML